MTVAQRRAGTTLAGEGSEGRQPGQEAPMVDYDAAMFWQVGRLGKDYDAWVHSPSSRSFRMFRTDFMEFFSKCHWSAVPVVWLPVVLLFALASLSCRALHLATDTDGVEAGNLNNVSVPAPLSAVLGSGGTAVAQAVCQADGTGLSWGGLGAWFFGGMLLWTLIEYSLHRWVFHMLFKDSWFWITFHFVMHGQHHKFPLDKGRLVFPPVAAAIIICLFHALFLAFLPTAEARGLTSGALLGYVLYDLTHYALHHGPPKIPWFQRLRKAHMDHHFRDCSKAFGISTLLWDYPFGTLGSAQATRAQ